MKRALIFIVTLLSLAAAAAAQNWTTITGSHIEDLAGNALASGKICFLGVDQNNTPINFAVGGGGQILRRAFCFTVTSGAIASGAQVPNPVNTSPAGVLYRIWVVDNATGQIVIEYPSPGASPVSLQGASWDFDNYAPAGNVVQPPVGGTINGPLNVSGSLSVTGSSALAALSATSLSDAGSFTAQSVNGVLNSNLYNWPSQTNSASITAGAMNTLALGSIPSGVTSGSVSIVSESSSSATITWVSGDHFLTGWASGKGVDIDGTYLTILSCSSSTSCTLSADAPHTTGYGWMIVGLPDSVYISGGTGTAESVDILGVGAECPSGTANSVCFWPQYAHSGSYLMQSATAGIQEAINVESATAGNLSAQGGIFIPAASYLIHAPIWNSRSGINIYGAGLQATHITGYAGAYSGPAHAWLTEFNVGHTGLSDLYISGNGVANPNMSDVVWACTTGAGGCGDNYMSHVQVDGAAGTAALDDEGNAMDAAGIYDDSNDGITVSYCVSIYNANDFYSQSNGGGSAVSITSGDYSDAYNQGLVLGGGGTTAIVVRGNRVFNDANAGVYIDGNVGVNIVGNHFESDNPAINIGYGVEGASIIGNLLSQHSDTTNACFICANTTSLNYAMDINHNEFDVQGEPTFSITNAVDVHCAGCTITNNVIDAFLNANETLQNYVTLESGSLNNTVRAYSLGPNAQLTGKSLTITNSVNDLSINYAAAAGDYYQNIPIITGPAGIVISSEPSANDHRLEISQTNGGFALGWYNHDNDFSCTFSSGECSIPWGLNLGDESANYLTFAGAASGSNPTTTAMGSDPNIGFTYLLKGTSQFQVLGASAFPIISLGNNGPQWFIGEQGDYNLKIGPTPTIWDMFISSSTGEVNLGTGLSTPTVTFGTSQTSSNCANSSDACGAAAAGAFTVAAGSTTVTVGTSAVTANSEIFVVPDSSLGTRLGVTCNTTLLTSDPQITARISGANFTVTLGTAPVTNPDCFNYLIVN